MITALAIMAMTATPVQNDPVITAAYVAIVLEQRHCNLGMSLPSWAYDTEVRAMNQSNYPPSDFQKMVIAAADMRAEEKLRDGTLLKFCSDMAFEYRRGQ